MFRRPASHPKPPNRDRGRWIFASGFLLIGVACFVAAVYFAMDSLINCGGSCTESGVGNIILGEFKFIGLICTGAIMLILGLLVFTLFKWGLFAERVPWQELRGRNRNQP